MIIATFMQLMEHFPALWAVLGIFASIVVFGAGAIVAIVVWKRYGPAAAAASTELVGLQREAVDLQKKTLDMQKEHYENELRYGREELEQWKKRAGEYEKALHDRRNEWNSEKLEMTTTIEKLKLRPNVDALFEFETKADERREIFYREMSSTMKAIHDSIASHDQDVAGKVEPMMASLTAILGQSKRQMKVLGILLREMREDRKNNLAKPAAKD